MTTKTAVAFLAALAVVLACAPARAELRARTRDLGAVSPVADYAQWTTATTMTGSACDVRASDLLTWKGSAVTFSRSDSTLCCPESDASCCTAAPNQPCVHGPGYNGWASIGTSAGGIEVFGPGANALTYTETFANAAWAKSAGVSASDASASCPMSPLAGTRMSLVTTDGEADQIAQDAATTPGRSVWLARATGDSACGITFADADGTGAQSVALTDGPLRYWSGGTGQTGLSVARPAGGCARWCMWAAQAQAVTYPVPYRTVVAGTPYSGAASTATTLTVPVSLTDPARWAISVTATPGGGWQRANLWLAQWGPINYGSASSTSLYVDGSYKLIGVAFDAGGAYRRLTSTAAQSGNGTRTVRLQYATPTPAVYLDSAEVPGALDGASAGQAALPTSTLTVGSSNAGNVNGLVSRTAICNRGGGACR